MTINDVLWVMCGIALAVLALISVVGGSGPRTSSMNAVYARRDRRLGQDDTSSPSPGTDHGPTAAAGPAAPATAPVTAPATAVDDRVARPLTT